MLANALPFRRSLLAIAISLACASATAPAATLNVGAGCTLIHAINNANADADTDGPKGCPAGSGADTINLGDHQTYRLTKVNNDTDGPNGLPSVTSVITINGNGSTVSRSSTTPGFRIFHVSSNGKLKLTSTTIRNGHLGGAYWHWRCYFNEYDSCYSRPSLRSFYGAGLLNKGKASLVDTVVTGNYILGFGGGIANSGTLTLTRSTVSNNSSSDGLWVYDYAYYNPGYVIANGGKGGGIFNTGKAVLVASTLSGNTAKAGDPSYNDYQFEGSGGGIFNSGEAMLTTSTLSGNLAGSSYNYASSYNYKSGFKGKGGGIFNSGKIVLTNATLSGNSAELSGGGIFNTDIGAIGRVTLKNTLIANSVHGDCVNNTNANIQSYGTNLIEDGSCAATLSGDPKLGSLKDNGGLTKTHALLDASPALDAGGCASFIDQRGVIRPQPKRGRCDIGAYERIPISQDNVSPTVWNLVDFITAQIAGGGLVGTGLQRNQNRQAMLNQLVVAGNYRDRALDAQACDQLTRLLRRIDIDNTPDGDDYVTGGAAGALAEQITQLKSDWECP